ncbi:C45 family autoproteolytic acyltransferase/hydolase [Lacinutrix jangbogonensis]|uniref:C45 family autoproteolytic acyltransferase/hydolase n=1 Tax=Lacinutrix jangbogonensis TaxID=1469557 RepID=UPI00053F2139|nr:C45 family peptidase [Lacinutrix jangbogonensis]
MKKLFIILFTLFLSAGCFAQQTNRELKTVSFSGSGYQLGLQHGKQLKKEIREIITAWKENTSKSLGKDANLVLKNFFEYAKFDDAIKKWTPKLYEEIKGIAEGSDQQLNDVLVLNLLDEFWVYINDLNNHHCSGLGVPAKNGKPGFISQNMDLENFTDDFQVLMRLNKTKNRPEQLILTHPGLIALNGLNAQGIGVCVNTIMQLKASSSGLPVAFIIRHIINTTDKEEVLDFIQTVNHASGQNYIIGIKGEIYDFEASANKVVRYNPNNENGTVYHTNHPVANDDLKPWYAKYNPNLNDELKPTKSNSYLRFKAVESRMADNLEISDVLIKEALRSKDNVKNPVCRTNNKDGRGFTFASVIMTFTKNPNIQILAGPPDESDYKTFEFSKSQ